MKKYIITIAFLMVTIVSAAYGQNESIYSFKVKDANGTEVSLEGYKGKVLLIVNTATRCGFTPQYTQLEEMYEKYSGKGFEILDFPCNQFGQQAPGTIQKIQEFCTLNYKVKFKQFDKIEVNGENAIALYNYLKSKKGNADNPNIRWNFTKFLISKDGEVLQRFEPGDSMDKVDAAVAELLK